MANGQLWRIAIFVGAVVGVANPAPAAVRKCGPIVSSEIVTAATELEAKKKALDQWRAKALKLGPYFDSWRLAAEKSLKCFPKQAQFECVAFGSPCLIDQTPKTPLTKPGKKEPSI